MSTERRRICNTPECRRMRALLSDYLDHSLHWRTARTLAAHLAACPPCAGFVASVETTILLYRERPVVDVPPKVRGHLRELLRERHANGPRGRAGRCCADAAQPGAAGRRGGGTRGTRRASSR